MTDFANLVLGIDSRQVKTGTESLDGLTASGERAEAAIAGVGRASSGAGVAAAKMAASAQASARAATGYAAGAKSVATASGLAAYQAQNLAFQLNDVATGLASGQAPFRVLAQQGGQFVQIMQQSGLGAKGFVVELLRMIGVLKVTRDAELATEAASAAAAAASVRSAAQRAAANIASADTELALAEAEVRTAATSTALAAAQTRLAAAHQGVAAAAAEAGIAEDALAVAEGRAAAAAEASAAKTVVGLGRIGAAALAIAVPLGVLTAWYKSFTATANPALEEYSRSLGLTRKELEKLKDVHITFGDVVKGTFLAIGDALPASIKDNAKAFSDHIKESFNAAIQADKATVNFIIGSMRAAYHTIIDTWSQLPAAIADSFVEAANKGIDAINGLLSGATSGINGFLSTIEGAVGKDLFGTLAAPQIGKLQNNWKGAAKAVGDTAKAEMDKYLGVDYVGMLADRILGVGESRIKDQADDLIADRADKAARKHKEKAEKLSEEEKAYRAAMKAAEDYLNGLQTETDSIGKNAIEQKRMEVATAAAAARKAAAVAPTKAQADALLREAAAIETLGATWERVTKEVEANTRVQNFIKNTIEPLEFENSLIGKSADAQRLLRAERELTEQGIDRGSAAWLRYIDATQKAIANDNALAEQKRILDYADRLSSAITDVITGTKSLKDAFSDLARSIISDILQMTIRMLIFRAISGIFGGAAGGGATGGSLAGVTAFPSANGNVFSGGNVIPFATGGIVTGPTMFPMSGGRTGLMGEAGPEAVMPLARDSQGRLGVRANDNASGPIEVHVTVSAAPELDARIEEVSGRQIGRAAPVIVKAAVKQSTRTLTRPSLMGGR